MKRYEKPALEIIQLTELDVITTSGCDQNTQPQNLAAKGANTFSDVTEGSINQE